MKKILILISLFLVVGFLFFLIPVQRIHAIITSDKSIGDTVDSIQGVYVYYNGSVSHTGERNLADDGYNLGLKYQCVEFIKRYYYIHYHHRMPDTYGNAKDFFDSELVDLSFNKKRGLYQFSNPSSRKPVIGDIIIFDGNFYNKYGHVAIISSVEKETIEIIQQNPGPGAHSRIKIPLINSGSAWKIDRSDCLGGLYLQQ